MPTLFNIYFTAMVANWHFDCMEVGVQKGLIQPAI